MMGNQLPMGKELPRLSANVHNAVFEWAKRKRRGRSGNGRELNSLAIRTWYSALPQQGKRTGMATFSPLATIQPLLATISPGPPI
jgi:hypothetical protein